MKNFGMLHVYTGTGKGKTSAALGLAMRAVGHGAKVVMICFMKGDPTYGEAQAFHFLPGLLSNRWDATVLLIFGTRIPLTYKWQREHGRKENASCQNRKPMF